jgi:hypothetical protein
MILCLLVDCCLSFCPKIPYLGHFPEFENWIEKMEFLLLILKSKSKSKLYTYTYQNKDVSTHFSHMYIFFRLEVRVTILDMKRKNATIFRGRRK